MEELKNKFETEFPEIVKTVIIEQLGDSGWKSLIAFCMKIIQEAILAEKKYAEEHKNKIPAEKFKNIGGVDVFIGTD